MSNESVESREYRVEGMSCSNCEKHVREAVENLSGVTAAEADAKSGLLRVSGADLEDGAITAAVDEAGYEVISR